MVGLLVLEPIPVSRRHGLVCPCAVLCYACRYNREGKREKEREEERGGRKERERQLLKAVGGHWRAAKVIVAVVEVVGA